MRILVFAIPVFALITACDPTRVKPTQATFELATIVEAVQYAIDQAADDTAWNATKAERDHWAASCKSNSDDSAKACGDMRNASRVLCDAACDSGVCSPIEKFYCEVLANGKAHPELCGSTNNGEAIQTWCTKADECLEKRKEAKRVCDAAKAISFPELQKADLSLKVEETKKQGTDISIFIVEFGSSRTSSSASTVSLEMKPRVRSEEYPGVDPLTQEDRKISEQAKELGSNLAELIKSAVRAGTLEIADDSGNVVRPPLALSGFKIELALSITDDGKLSVGKEWDSVPASISIGGEGKSSLANTLTITYARSE